MRIPLPECVGGTVSIGSMVSFLMKEFGSKPLVSTGSDLKPFDEKSILELKKNRKKFLEKKIKGHIGEGAIEQIR